MTYSVKIDMSRIARTYQTRTGETMTYNYSAKSIIYLTLDQKGTVLANHGNDADAARASGYFVLPWNSAKHTVPAVGSIYRA